MQFLYTGTDPVGNSVQGKIEAENKNEAQENLTQQGITVISIDLDDKKNLISKINFFNYPSVSDLIIFAKQMHSLLRAGVPIIRSINIVSDSCKNRQLSTTLTRIASRLEAGSTFERSMEKYPKVFPKIVTALVGIGEQTGNLANIFQQISLNLHKEHEIKKGVKTAMRYPILVVTTIFIAMVIINILVIPSFAKFFSTFKAKLPLPTRILMAISSFSVQYWWLIIFIMIGIIFGIVKYVNTPRGKYLWDKYKIKFPIFGSIFERTLLIYL